MERICEKSTVYLRKQILSDCDQVASVVKTIMYDAVIMQAGGVPKYRSAKTARNFYASEDLSDLFACLLKLRSISSWRASIALGRSSCL